MMEPHLLPEPGVSRRSLLTTLVALAGLTTLASCGDDTRVTDATGVDGTTGGAPAGTAGVTHTHPTGPDDVVVRVGYVGGFVQVGAAFMNVPTVLVSGNGRLITPGVTTAIYPGPLLPALDERTITEDGIQRLLAAAERAGLLGTPPDYSMELMVADAPDTLVQITTDAGTFVHQAPALDAGSSGEVGPRGVLADFVRSLDDVSQLVGEDQLGASAALVAGDYRVQARTVGAGDLAGREPAPRMVPWPDEVGVRLGDATGCVVIAVDRVGALLAGADQNTFFTEGGLTYQLAAIALLPGDRC